MNNGRGLQEDGSFNVIGPNPEKRVSSDVARAARQEFRNEKKEARKEREAERREMHASAPVKPSAQVKAADHVKPADQVRPADPVRPAAAARPADPVKPAAAVRPSDPVRREAPPSPRQQEAAREQPKTTDLSGIIGQAVQAALGRGVTEEQVRRIVRQMVPAFVCNMSRMPPGGDVERVRVGLDGDTLVWREEGGPVGGSMDYPFRCALTKDAFDRTVLSVSAGRWTRNGYTAQLEAQTLTAPNDAYVWLELIAENSDLLPALCPDKILLRLGPEPPDESGTMTCGIYWTLGKVDSDGVWEQWWKGGDIDDHSVVPDGYLIGPSDGDEQVDPPPRRTIDFNEESGREHGALQLYGVNTVVCDTYSVPYFLSDKGGGTSHQTGELKWATMDAHNTVTKAAQKSIEVKDNILQIRGIDAALNQQMLVWDKTASEESEIKYHYPVLYTGGPRLTSNGSGPATADIALLEFVDKSSFYIGRAANEKDFEVQFTSTPAWINDGRINFGASSELHTYTLEMGDFSLSDHTHPPEGVKDNWDGPKEERGDWFSHKELKDMPDSEGANADHDGRYWAKISDNNAAADTHDYSTSGKVYVGGLYAAQGPLALYGDGLTYNDTAGSSEDVPINERVTLHFSGGLYTGATVSE